MSSTLSKITNLATWLGMPFDLERSCDEHPLWDGKIAAWRGVTHSNILHEIAHWIVATPEERVQTAFGCGAEPQGVVSAPVQLLRVESSVACETRASALGIALEWSLGLDWRATAEDHGWDPSGRDLPRKWDDLGLTVNPIITKGTFDPSPFARSMCRQALETLHG